MRRKLTVGVGIIIIVSVGYFSYQNITRDVTDVEYVMAAAEKGTLIISVSGSGQVSVVDQTEIRTKVSGEVVWVGVSAGQKVRQWQAILSLDDADIQTEIIDAEWDLNEERDNQDEVVLNAERSLTTAYEDGYSTVSTAFFGLSDYTEDLRDVSGAGQNEEKHIGDYKLILGTESLLIKNFINDRRSARDIFNEKFTLFGKLYKENDRDTVYQLIGDTLETAKVIAQALESARHMYDAITIEDYKRLNIVSHIRTMQPAIESDVSSVYSTINSLQKIKDTIDDAIKNFPKDIATAKRNVEKKEKALEELQKELSEHIVRAPYAGIIIKTNVKRGDSVSFGSAVVIIITEQKLAEISLNEVDVARVEIGQLTTLTFDAVEDVTLTGKVIEIDALGKVSQGVVTYNLKIAFDIQDERIKPGMTIDAAIITERRDSIVLVPNSAVQTQGGQIFVDVLENGLPRSVPVEVGLSNEISTEIISGLREGAQVVTARLGGGGGSQTANISQSFRIPGLGGRGSFRGGGGSFVPH